jgi:predicted amidohydrolase YtcJ
MAGVRAAVTGAVRDGSIFEPQENVTVETALRAYTGGAAHALGMDDAGVLRPGALGDFVLFDRDPFAADWLARPPRVVLTVARGGVAYDADAPRGAATGREP